MILRYKMRQILFQNVTAMLLQNTAKLYYKMRQVLYEKMRLLLQIVTVLLQNAIFTTISDIYYKMRQYNVCIVKA